MGLQQGAFFFLQIVESNSIKLNNSPAPYPYPPLPHNDHFQTSEALSILYAGRVLVVTIKKFYISYWLMSGAKNVRRLQTYARGRDRWPHLDGLTHPRFYVGSMWPSTYWEYRFLTLSAAKNHFIFKRWSVSYYLFSSQRYMSRCTRSIFILFDSSLANSWYWLLTGLVSPFNPGQLGSSPCWLAFLSPLATTLSKGISNQAATLFIRKCRQRYWL